MPDCWVEFPLDQPLEGDAVEIASPFNFPPEGAYALFWFTNETFTQVLSALWNGAILTYPEQAYQVIWYFLQNVEVPVQLCEQVALCFANDEEFRQSVVNSLSIDPSFTQVINNISTTGTPMTQPQIEAVVGDNCDEDVLFGGIVVLIDQMNTNNLDFMQVFEVATNLVERASALVAAVPIFETLPFDDLIEFVDRFFNEIYENYEAEVTTSLLNEYKCDLFCIALGNEGCGFTYETLYNYFKARVDGAFTIDSLFQVVIEALASGSYSGSLIADFMYMLQIQVMRSASNFLGVNVLALQTSYNIGALTPDHSWALIPCDCAPPPEGCVDFTSEEGDWEVFDIATTWISGQGYRGSFYAPIYYVAQIVRPASATTITDVTVRLNNAADEVRLTNGDQSITYTSYSGTPLTEVVFTGLSIPGAGGIGFRVQWNNNDASDRIIEACIVEE